jgi:hypothetical protein
MVLMTQDRTNGVWAPGYNPERKPSLEDIMTLYKEGKRYFESFHANCKLEDDYYLGRRDVAVPIDIEKVWPSTATAIVNVATDHVDVNNLSIDVPSTARSRARAERLKKFYQGAWLSIKKPVLRTSVRQAFLYDISFLRTMFEAQQWPDPPAIDSFDSNEEYREALKAFMEKRCIRWPFDVTAVNPKNMIWDDSKSDMKWAIEFDQRSSQNLARRYPQWAEHRKRGQMVEFIRYWDEEWAAYIADGELVWGPERHGYGFMPYEPILPVQSFTFEDGPPHERYRGVLKPAHSLLDEEARLVAQINTLVRTTAWRTLDFSGPRQLAEQAAQEYELFGGKNILPPGVQVAMSPMAQVPPDLYQQLNVVQTLIEQVTFPNVIRGVRPRGVSTGFAISVLAGMGRLVFQGVADGLRHAIEAVNSHFAQLVENKLKGSVTVHARTEVHQFDQMIGPDDIRGYYENIVQVKAEAPEEREREALLAMRLYQGIPGFSMYEALRRSGVANPLEMIMQRKAEDLLNLPEIQASLAQQLLERVGLPGQLVQATSPTGGGVNIGAQNVGGAQLPRPGERNIQAARTATRDNRPSVFPQGMGGLDILGGNLGTAGGGPQNLPSGQRISS